MFKVSEFSQFTRVSVKMLHHYDQIGLLKPAHVDPFSGYRYYSVDQLPRLNRLIAFKDLGFSLEQVAKLLSENLSAHEMRGMLRLRQGQIENQLRQESAQLAQVEARLRVIEQCEQPDQQLINAVVIKDVAPHLAATCRQTIIHPQLGIGELLGESEAYVARHRARAAAPPMFLCYDDEYSADSMDVEMTIPITHLIPTSSRFSVREIPGWAQTACLVCQGSPDELIDAYSVMLIWVAAHGYRIAGPVRVALLRYPCDRAEEWGLPAAFIATQPDELVTELQVSIQNADSKMEPV